MATRSATQGLVALGFIAGEIAVAAAGADAKAPEWIRVTPRGAAPTRDGRRYSFDPETLAARFASDGIDVPVDTDHGLALRATKGERVDAIGYAAELQARPDGTFARVNWLDGGQAVLAARTHRYVSPTFHHDETGRATWLHSISLVAAPALSMPALLHALGDLSENPMKQIAKALGLPETADEAACLRALAARPERKVLAQALQLPETMETPALLSAVGEVRVGLRDIAKKLGLNEGADAASCLAAIGRVQSGGNDIVATLQASLTETTTALTTLQADIRQKDVTALLEDALEKRKIVPAQREHYATLCATDDGLKAVRAMLAATAPGLQASGLDTRGPADGGTTDPATLSAKAKKLQREREEAGQPIGFAEAVALAAEQK